MGTVVRQAQAILQRTTPSLVIDGVWGRQSDEAFTKAPLATQHQIKQLFTDAGKVPPWDRRLITEGEVVMLVSRACASLNMSAYSDVIVKIIKMEARRERINGQVMYDANSRNGGSRGLMQMQRAAWSDAMKVDKTLPAYDDGVYDPYTNIRAGCAFTLSHIRSMMAWRVPVTASNIYRAHNQGMGYFTGRRTAVDKQSPQARAILEGRAEL